MFILDFPVTWYLFLSVWFVFWLVLPPRKRDMKKTVQFGLLGTLLGVGVEILAVFLGLWAYTGGNWPVILWPSYFLASMIWYQLFNFFESRK